MQISLSVFRKTALHAGTGTDVKNLHATQRSMDNMSVHENKHVVEDILCLYLLLDLVSSIDVYQIFL
jgi:hypothetical protein